MSGGGDQPARTGRRHLPRWRSAGGGAPVLTRRQLLADTLGLSAAIAVTALTRDGLRDDLVTRCRFGAYAVDEPNPLQPHFDLEASLGGTRLPVASWFQEWGGSWPTDQAATLADRGGYDVLMCLEAHGIVFADVLAGDHDSWLTEYLAAASASAGLVVVRPFHESNGDWYDWAPAAGSGLVTDAEQWKDTWRHVVEVGRAADAPDVRFLFCPNATDSGDVTIEDLWPGAEHVDLIGCDGYSWNGTATSFDDVHADAYDRLTALHPTADYWIGETGLTEQSGSADWYRAAYRSQRFPRLTTACWFSRGEFRVDADDDAVAVHAAQLARAPQYSGLS